ncbi:MAG: hypothetical protein AB7N76_33415 [Planctomycetota bacterium]
MTASPERLVFDDLEPYVLLKNGNDLYKVPFRGGWAVLKVYYGSRSWPETWLKSLGNVIFEGQTSYLPKTRLRMELECLQLWARHGFRVFQPYPEVEVQAPNCPAGGYLLLEYVSAPKLEEVLADAARPLEERMELYRRWLAEWCRRHDLAEQEREPRLVHENGDAGHVMILEDGRFLWFDFEMVYRSRSKVREYVGHEIVQYVWQLLRKTPADMHERLLEETARHYPDRARLRFAPDVFLDHPRALVRAARAIDMRRKRGKKPSSKYALARRLRDHVEALG